jgi:LuxR family maltose regulon positive regulatory protein
MLLQAKISIPGSDRPLLQRCRLLGSLDPSARLLFINGPAGSGKTSLIISYVQQLQQPVAWYSLDPSDADPAVFLRYLTASLAMIKPAIGHKLTSLVGEPPFESQIASDIAQAVNSLLPRATLVLDDLHSIELNNRLDPLIGAVLNALLRYCPDLQLIIASRQMLNLDSIITLLARGQAQGLSGQALAFTADEIDQLFQQTLGAPDPAERHRLSTVCAGWATAIAFALTTRSPAVLPHVQDREVLYAYLANQVLDQLPSDLRDFVIDTAVLDYLSSQRCDLLRHRSDSGAQLAELIRRNVFLSSAGEDTFRYHPLFREFLLDRLRRQPDHYRALIMAAADIAKHERRWEWAFNLAAQASEWEIATDLILAAGPQLRIEGRHTTLLSWLQIIPRHAYLPWLWWLKARLLADQGHLEDALLTLDFAARGTDHDRMLAQLLRARIEQLQGHLDTAAELVAPYLDDPYVPVEWQPQVLRIEGIRLAQHGDYKSARGRLQQALALIREKGELADVATINQDLGVVELWLGAFDRAEQYFRNADACWKQLGEGIHRSTTLNNLGMVLLKRGRLQEAKQQLNTALELAQQFGRPRDRALICASLGDVALAAGALTEAGAHYAAAHVTALEGGYARLANYALAASAHSARLRGDRAVLIALLDQLNATLVRTPLERAWIKGAIAGALWMLELPGALEAAREALEPIAQDDPAERAPLLLLYAQILFGHGQVREAFQIFGQLNDVAARLPSLHTLACWAAAAPSLLEAAAERGNPLALRLHLNSPQQVVVPSSTPPLTIRTLGAESIVRGSEAISGGGPITREVFFCLLAAGNGGLPVEVLRESVWGDDGDPTGQALKTAIKRIRRDICDVRLEVGHYVLQLPPNTDYDVHRFLELLQQPATIERLNEAVELYKGPYLSRIEQPWIVDLRNNLAERYVEARIELATRLASTDALAALDHYRAALNVDPYRVGALIGAMQIEAALGRRTQALDRFHDYAKHMVNELGLDPDRSVDRVYRQLLNEA